VSSPGSARSLRKRQAAAKVLTKKPVAKKAALKKAGTMQKTAKVSKTDISTCNCMSIISALSHIRLVWIDLSIGAG